MKIKLSIIFLLLVLLLIPEKGEGSYFSDGTLLKAEDDVKIYVVYNYSKRWLRSPSIFKSYGFEWGQIQTIKSLFLNQIPNAKLIKLSDRPEVYFIENKQKRWIESPQAFILNGFHWDEIHLVNQLELNNYTDGASLGIEKIMSLPSVSTPAPIQTEPSQETASWPGFAKPVLNDFIKITTNPELNIIYLDYPVKYRHPEGGVNQDFHPLINGESLKITIKINGQEVPKFLFTIPEQIKALKAAREKLARTNPDFAKIYDADASVYAWTPEKEEKIKTLVAFKTGGEIQITAVGRDAHLDYSSEIILDKKFTVQEQIPAVKEFKLLVLPVTTSDISYPSFATQDWIEKMVFSKTENFSDLGRPASLALWWDQTSYGKVKITGYVHPLINLGKPFSYYAETKLPSTSIPILNRGIQEDAVRIASLDTDFSQFDADQNDEIDFVLILSDKKIFDKMRAAQASLGSGCGFSSDFSFIASADGIFEARGKKATLGLMAALPCDINGCNQTYGAYLHEAGHLLSLREWGIKHGRKSHWDNYGLSEQYYPLCFNVQRYEIMANGVDNVINLPSGKRFNSPSLFGGYTKMRLGYLTPQIIPYGQSVSLRLYRSEEQSPYSSRVKLVKVMRDAGDSHKYYLLELRSNQQFSSGHNFDVGLTDGGLMIYQVTERPNEDNNQDSWIGTLGNVGGPEGTRKLCSKREEADLQTNVLGVNPLYQNEIAAPDLMNIHSPKPFGKASGVYEFNSPEGIKIKIANEAADGGFIDLDISF